MPPTIAITVTEDVPRRYFQHPVDFQQFLLLVWSLRTNEMERMIIDE
jgi:hypothetical protein